MLCWGLWSVAYTCYVVGCGQWPIRTLFLILNIHRLLIFKFWSFHITIKCSHTADNIHIYSFNSTKQYGKRCLPCCSNDTNNSDEARDDRQEVGFELTTMASDIYNVYYPVMEAQLVTERNGRTFAVTEYAKRSFWFLKFLFPKFYSLQLCTEYNFSSLLSESQPDKYIS